MIESQLKKKRARQRKRESTYERVEGKKYAVKWISEAEDDFVIREMDVLP